MRYITLVPPRELVQEARALHRKLQYETQREHLHNSFTKGKSTPYGMLAELLVPWYYQGISFERQRPGEVFEYDWLVDLLRRLEIKGKKCTSAPEGHYFSSVADTRRDHQIQDCDWFCFVRVQADFSKAYLLGFLPKDLFVEQSQYFCKGEIDPTSNGQFLFKQNCWNVHTYQLLPPPLAGESFAGLVNAADALRADLYASRHSRQYSIFADVC